MSQWLGSSSVVAVIMSLLLRLGYVKALPQEERSAFILRAINEGDRATVASVLHAQPFLSGLSADDQRTLRQQAGPKFAPLDHANRPDRYRR